MILGLRLRGEGVVPAHRSGHVSYLEIHLPAVTGTHFWSQDWGRKVEMETQSEKTHQLQSYCLRVICLFIFDVDHF